MSQFLAYLPYILSLVGLLPLSGNLMEEKIRYLSLDESQTREVLATAKMVSIFQRLFSIGLFNVLYTDLAILGALAASTSPSLDRDDVAVLLGILFGAHLIVLLLGARARSISAIADHTNFENEGRWFVTWKIWSYILTIALTIIPALCRLSAERVLQ